MDAPEKTPKLSSRNDPDLPFDIDAAHSGVPRFHWESDSPGLTDLRIEGTFELREGRLVIDRLTSVEPSHFLVGEDGERRRRMPTEATQMRARVS